MDKIMGFEIAEHYQIKSRETHQIVSFGNDITTYSVLGLVDECAELAHKLADWGNDISYHPQDKKELYIWEILLEAGDCLWYTCQICTDLGIDFQSRFDFDPTDFEGLKPNMGSVIDLCVSAGMIAGIWKKVFRDSDGVLSSDKHSDISDLVSGILFEIGCVLYAFGFTVEKAMNANLVKLFDRMERGVINGDGDNR